MNRIQEPSCLWINDMRKRGLDVKVEGVQAAHIVHRATVFQVLLDEAALGGIEPRVHGVGFWNLGRRRGVMPNGVQENELLHLELLKHRERAEHQLLTLKLPWSSSDGSLFSFRRVLSRQRPPQEPSRPPQCDNALIRRDREINRDSFTQSITWETRERGAATG